jgi:hypothetical protein
VVLVAGSAILLEVEVDEKERRGDGEGKRARDRNGSLTRVWEGRRRVLSIHR